MESYRSNGLFDVSAVRLLGDAPQALVTWVFENSFWREKEPYCFEFTVVSIVVWPGT